VGNPHCSRDCPGILARKKRRPASPPRHSATFPPSTRPPPFSQRLVLLCFHQSDPVGALTFFFSLFPAVEPSGPRFPLQHLFDASPGSPFLKEHMDPTTPISGKSEVVALKWITKNLFRTAAIDSFFRKFGIPRTMVPKIPVSWFRCRSPRFPLLNFESARSSTASLQFLFWRLCFGFWLCRSPLAFWFFTLFFLQPFLPRPMARRSWQAPAETLRKATAGNSSATRFASRTVPRRGPVPPVQKNVLPFARRVAWSNPAENFYPRGKDGEVIGRISHRTNRRNYG